MSHFTNSRTLVLLLIASVIGCAPDRQEAPSGFQHTGGQWTAEALEGAHPLTARFDASAVSIERDAAAVEVRFTGWSLDGQARSVAAVAPRVGADRLEYDRGDVIEYWEVQEAGIRQSWRFDTLPQGEQLDLTVGFDTPVTVQNNGLVATFGGLLSWSGLVAHDATGRRLWARMHQAGSTAVRIAVEVTDAVAPIVVDPLFASTPSQTISGTNQLGLFVVSLEDSNNDGVPDVAYGGNQSSGVLIQYGTLGQGMTSGVEAAVADDIITIPATGPRPINTISAMNTVGDVNGDGLEDFAVGSDTYNSVALGSTLVGAAYFIYGGTTGFTSGSIETVADDIITGVSGSGDRIGGRIHGIGDFNNDGFGDVLIGGKFGGTYGEGAAYIMLGSATGVGSGTTISEADWILSGRSTSNGGPTNLSRFTDIQTTGFAVGDFNNDGFSDFAVGHGSSTNIGIMWVVNGRATLPADGDIDVLADTTITDGIGAAQQLWGTGALATDLNGDGFDDLLVSCGWCDVPGVPNAPGLPASYAGKVYAFHGGPTGIQSGTRDGVSDAVLNGASPNGRLGWDNHMASMGDVNGDGYGDLAIMDRGGNTGPAIIHQIAGTFAGLPSGSAADVATESLGYSSGAEFGARMNKADHSGDGFDDLVTGDSTSSVVLQFDGGETPLANPDTLVVTGSGASGSVDVLANDTTPTTPLIYANVTVISVTNGTANVDASNNEIDYTHDGGAATTDQIIYSVCDQSVPQSCARGFVDVTVSANTPPAPVADTASVVPGGAIAIDVLANDVAGTGGALNYTNVTVLGVVTGGTVSVDALNGEIDFTRDATTTTGLGFTYQICDGGSPNLCTTAAVTVTDPDPNLLPAFSNIIDLIKTSPNLLATGSTIAVDTTATSMAVGCYELTDFQAPSSVSPGTASGWFYPVNGVNPGSALAAMSDLSISNSAYNLGSDNETFTWATDQTGRAFIAIEQGGGERFDVVPTNLAGADIGTTTYLPATGNGPSGGGWGPILYNITSYTSNDTTALNRTMTAIAFQLSESGVFGFRVPCAGATCSSGDFKFLSAAVNLTTDADGDGTCDAQDACVGDDTLGDPDFDYFCGLMPTVTDIGNQSVNAGVATSPIAITVGDNEDGAAAVTLTATSSDQTVCPNGSCLTVAGTGANRTLVITGAAAGTATITLTVTDAGGATNTDTFVVTVAANSAPVAVADAASTPFETAGTIDVLANDTDADGDSLTITSASTPASGGVSINAAAASSTFNVGGSNSTAGLGATDASGSLFVVSSASTITSISVQSSCSAGSGTQNIVVARASGGAYTVISDTPISLPTCALATYSTGTISVALEPGGTYFVGVYAGGSVGGTSRRLVPAVAGPPWAGTYTGQATLSFAGGLGGTGTISSAPSGASAFLVIATEGRQSVDYTPNASFVGVDTFTYDISDGNGGTDTGTVTVTVTNTDPTISDVADQTINEDAATSALAVTIGDTEEAASALTLTVSSSNTTLVPNANLVLAGSGTARTITATPAADQNGSSTITLTVTDSGGATATDTFLLTVTPVADDPVVVNVVDQSVAEDGSGTVTVTVSDADGGVPTLTASSSDQTLCPDGTCLAIIGLGPTYTLVLTPAANENGTATITLTATDAGGATGTDTFVLTVSNTNDAPVAVDDTASTPYAVAVATFPLANDTDADGDTLSVVSFTQGGDGGVTSTGTGGTNVFSVNGTTTLAPLSQNRLIGRTVVADTDRTLLSFGFEVFSSATRTTDIAVYGTGQGGFTLLASQVVTVPPGTNLVSMTGLNIPLTAGSTYYFCYVNTGQFQIRYTNGTGPQPTWDDGTGPAGSGNAQVFLNSAALPSSFSGITIFNTGSHFPGSIIVDDPVVLTYTPNAGFAGVDSFTYDISDGNSGTDQGLVTVTVTNTAPTISDVANQAITENSNTGALAVIIGDTEEAASALTMSYASSNTTLCPATGCVAFGGSGASRTATVTPATNALGTTTVTLTVTDGAASTATDTFTVTVTCVADFNNDGECDSFDTDIDGDGDLNATDCNDGDITIYTGAPEICGDGTIQDCANTVDEACPTAGQGQITEIMANPDGADSNGGEWFELTIPAGTAAFDLFGFTVCDANSNCFTVGTAVPVVAGDRIVFGGSADLGVGFVGVDVEWSASNFTLNNAGDTITITAPNATVLTSLNYGAPGFPGDTEGQSIQLDTAFTDEQVGANWNTTPAATTYGTSGANAGTPGGVNLGLNQAPVAGNDTLSTDEDTVGAANLFANDSDPDLDTITVTLVNGSAANVGTAITVGSGLLTVTSAGAASFDPNGAYESLGASASGSASFTYTISDGLVTDSATVSITIAGVNDAPVAVADPLVTSQDTAGTITAMTNDTDADSGDTLTVSAVTQGSNGAVTFSGGAVTYTPTSGFVGSDSFGYTVSDGNGGTDAGGLVTVTVTNVNDAPIANADAFTIAEDAGASTVDVVLNDSDPDGTTPSLSAVTQGTSGSVAMSSGNAVYTPNLNFNGTDTFTYSITDGSLTDTATVTVTVTAVNDAPIAVADAFTVNEDAAAAAFTVIGNDTDVDAGTTLSLSSVGTPSIGGSAQVSGNQISYAPGLNVNGTETVTYIVSDGSAGQATGTVTFTITAQNDAPVAVNDTLTTSQDVSGTINAVNNDTDVDLDTLFVSAVSTATSGSTSFTGGTVTYTPNTGFVGTDSFTYTVSDGDGGTDTGTVSVNVNNVNDAPVAVADSTSTPEDTAVTLNVITNDTDADGDTLSLLSVGTVTNGTLSSSGNDVTFTPAADVNGAVSFTYVVRDPSNATDTGTVTITVTAVNDLPTAVADTDTTLEDTAVTIDVLANDSDIEDAVAALTVDSVSTPSSGTAAIVGNQVVFTPAANSTATATFSYTMSDSGGLTATAGVTVTVTGVNDAPVANADTAGTNEDTAVVVPVLTNDTDIDGDTLTLTGASGASDGTLAIAGGQVTYTPDADFNGSDSFGYAISDGNGGTANGTVTVTVAAINDAPVAVANAFSVNEDALAANFDVVANDTDVDLDALSLLSVGTPTNGGTATLNAGLLSYAPAANVNGTETVSYVVTDGGLNATGTVTFTIASVNDAPVAQNDTGSTPQDTAGIFNVLANDSDLDLDALLVTGVSQGTSGAVVISNAGADVTYTPNSGFVGSDLFSYTVSDGNGGTDTASVAVTVSNVNDTPVANADTATTNEDAAVVVLVLANDTDADGDTLTITGATAPSQGTVGIATDLLSLTYTPDANTNGTDTFSYVVGDGNGASATGTVTVTITAINDAPVAVADADSTNEDTAVTVDVVANDTDVDAGTTLTLDSVAAGTGGTVAIVAGDAVFTPTLNFNGTATFTYVVTDGALTGTGTATITVNPVNDPPVVVADTPSSNEDQTITITPLVNDSDVDGDTLSISAFTQPAAGGTVTQSGGTLTFVPTPNFNGTATFGYTVSDGNGGSTTGTVTVTVTATNDAPVAVTDAASAVEDGGAIIVQVLANDTDAEGDSLTVASVTQPPNGSTAIVGLTVSYTPDSNVSGSDSFTYVVSDGNGGLDTGTVNITIAGVNDAPIAIADTAQTNEDAAVTIPVLANDSDPDGDTLTITAAGNGANGTTAIAAGTIVYTPNPNFAGADGFTYTITDPSGATDTALVLVTITGVNDAPVAVADAVTTLEDTAVTIQILANDTDADLNALLVTSTGQGTSGTVTNAGSSVTYTPTANFFGTDTFTYVVSDGQATDTGTVTVTVTGVNDQPTISDISNQGIVQSTTTGPIGFTVGDVEDGAAGVTIVATSGDITLVPAIGITLDTTGASPTITVTPTAGLTGASVITVTVTDTAGAVATDTFTLTVSPPSNTAPSMTAVVNQAISEDGTTGALNITLADTEDPLSALVLTATSSDVTVVASSGIVLGGTGGARTIAVTPTANQSGLVTITLTLTDTGGLTAAGSFDLLVNAVNDAPVAVADSASTVEDQAVLIAVLGNDSDIEGDTLTPTVTSTPSGGAATVVGAGISYAPNLNFNGSDSFTYAVSDGNGGSASATVTVTVTAQNDAPVATAQTVSTNEDTSLSLTLAGTDVENNALTFLLVGTPSNGALTGTPPSLSYAPNANFNGSDSFQFVATDGQATSTAATVSIVVNAINDVPTISDITAQGIPEDGTSGPLGFTITDVEDAATALTVTVSSSDSTLFPSGSMVLAGTGASRTVALTPAPSLSGQATITLTVTDSAGASATDTILVTVVSGNDVPTITGVADQTLAEDTATAALSFTVLDQEDASTALTVTATSSDLGVVPLVGIALAGTGSNREVVVTPAANANGSSTLTLTVTDTGGLTASDSFLVAVTAVNDAPVAVADAATTSEDTALSVDVVANDTDVDLDALTVSTFDAASTQGGTVAAGANGRLVYTPLANFNGADTFDYTVTDSNGGTDTATVTVTVNALNDTPFATAQTLTTNEDTVLSIVLAGTDTENDPLTFLLVGNPSSGGLSGTAPTLTYTPNANFNGTDAFSFVATDGAATSSAATVFITVNPVNDLPTITDVANQGIPEDGTSGPLGFTIGDVEDGASALGLAVVAADTTLFPSGSIVLGGAAAARTVTLTPAATLSGTSTITLTVTDSTGATATDSFVASVIAGNDPPTITAIANQGIAEDTPTSALGFAVSDLEDASTALVVTAISSDSTVVGTAGLAVGGSGGTRSVTVSPVANASGTTTITLTVTDTSGLTATEAFDVTVTPVNDLPVVTAPPAQTIAEDSATGALGFPISDVEDAASALVVTASSNNPAVVPASGIALGGAASARTVNVTPAGNAFGSATITLTVTDSANGSTSATFVVTVGPANDAPLAAADTATVDEASSTSIDVLANDGDLDGDALLYANVTIATAPAAGTATVGTSSISYQHDGGQVATDSIEYTICDGNGGCDSATVTITINPVNDAPVGVADSVTTPEDIAVLIDVTGNDTDADGDALTVDTFDVASVQGGTIAASSNGLLYTPAANFVGSDSFTYAVTDGLASDGPNTVTIAVTAVNDAPIANAAAVSTDEDAALAITLTGSDIDANPLTYLLSAQPSSGLLSGTAPSLTYTPAANFNGSDSFDFVVSDGNATSGLATITITVNSINDAPMADTLSVQTPEDTPIAITLTGTDIDGDAMTFNVTSLPTNGSIGGTPPTVTYTPNTNYAGPDSFSYVANDGTVSSVAATVTIAVSGTNDAPVADAGGPYTGNEGSGVLLNGSGSSDTDGNIVTWEWDCDGDGTYDTTAASATGAACTYPDEGTTTLVLRVTDDGGLQATTTTTATIDNVAPTLAAPVLPAGAEGVALTFVATATDPGSTDVLTFNWDFGDGTQATGASAINTYATAGTYAVTVTVTDGDGGQDVSTSNVVISGGAPSITSLTGDVTLDEASPGTWVVVATDAGTSANLTYDWSFGDGSTQLNAAPAVTYTWDDDGTYTVTLTVTDDEGDSSVSSLAVVVDNVDPVLDTPTIPAGGNEAQSLAFSGTATDVSPVDVLTFAWDFGDGTTVTGASAFHPYDDDGTYTVTLTVTDDDGGSDTTTDTVTVGNLPPTVTAVTGDLVGNEGDTLSWSAATTDPSVSDAAGLIVGWDFGDTVGTDQGDTVSYAYTDEGTYTLTLTVSDDDGGSSVDTSFVVDVLNVAPEIVSNAPVNAVQNSPWSYAPIAQDPGDDTLTWSLSTSAPSGMLVDSATGGLFWLPTYDQSLQGSFSFTLSVGDGDGGSDTQAITVFVDSSDTDGDGMSDGWELDNGLDPNDPTDAYIDSDGDGLLNIAEFQLGTDPFVFDGPTEPVPVSPIAGVEEPENSPDLVWDNATDPQGDPLTYTVQVFSDSALLVPLTSLDGIAEEASGQTSWKVDVSIPENSIAWWRVRASDPFGDGNWSQAESFFVNEDNDEPGTPVVVSPIDVTVDNGFPTLTWTNVDDVDNDAVTYSIEVWDIDGTTILASTAGVSEAEDINSTWDVDAELGDDADYSWRVAAVDEHGLQGAWSDDAYFTVNSANGAPGAVAFLTPAAGAALPTVSPLLAIAETTDPDGDDLVYIVEVDTVETFDGGDFATTTLPASFTGEVRWNLLFDGIALTENTTGYARAWALDTEGAAGPVDTISFFLRGENDAPDVPVLIDPIDPTTDTASSRPTLTVATPIDHEGDTVRIDFIVFEDALGNIVVTDVEGVLAGSGGGAEGQTGWALDLDIIGTFYWTARATDADGATSDWAEIAEAHTPIPIPPPPPPDEPQACDDCQNTMAPGEAPSTLTFLLVLLSAVPVMRRRRR